MFYTVTYKNTPILKDWSTNPKSVHTGIDLSADNVYSYASGVVLSVGQENNHYCVTVQYDVFNLLRYNHLKSVSVGAGDILSVGAFIGVANKYVHFEYATKDKGVSKWTVRVGSQTYWKQDPKELLA